MHGTTMAMMTGGGVPTAQGLEFEVTGFNFKRFGGNKSSTTSEKTPARSATQARAASKALRPITRAPARAWQLCL